MSSRLILIANRFTDPDCRQAVLDAVRAGVTQVQLRDHEATPRQFRAAADRFIPVLRTAGVRTCWVNTDIETARRWGTDLHLGFRGPPVATARRRLGSNVRISVAAHQGDASRSCMQAADQLSFSPVFPTSSKPGHPGTGRHGLGDFCRSVAPTPVYALGGITPARVRACLDAGAVGVMVLSGIVHASNPYRTAREYLREVQVHAPA